MKKEMKCFLFIVITYHILFLYIHYIQYYSIFLPNNRIDINNCGWEELQVIPGIGERTAWRIYHHRQKKGGFFDMKDLQNVKGIRMHLVEEKYIHFKMY